MSTSSWYYAKNSEKHVHQLVIQLSPDSRIAPRVANLVVDAAFMAPNWAVTALVDSQSALPVIFAKASGAIDLLQGEPADVVFAFYHLSHGGVFQIFVQVDSADLRSKVGYPFLAEHARWPDEEEDRRIVEALIASDNVELCFVAPGEKGPCTGYFGLMGSVAPECRERLKQEWEDLRKHHNAVQARDFEFCLQQYNRENPMAESPILTRPDLPTETETASKEKELSPETLGAIFQALASNEAQEGDILEIVEDGTVSVAEQGFGFTEYDIVELYNHGIRKVGDIELTHGVYDMAQMALQMGAERQLSDLASTLIREQQEKKERKHKKKAKVETKPKRAAVPIVARGPVEIWRLVLIPCAITLALNLFGLFVFHWSLFPYLMVNGVLIVAVGIHSAFQLDRAGEWPPENTRGQNPREELGGCIGGLFVLGLLFGVLAGAMKLSNTIMMPIVFVSLGIYALLQLFVYPKLFKALIIYACIVRAPEIIGSFFVTPGMEGNPIRIANILSLSVTTALYATWFGMIAAAVLDWRGERQGRRRASPAQPSILPNEKRRSTKRPEESAQPFELGEAQRHYQRGVENAEQENWKNAASDFAAAVKADPNSPVYLYSLAISRTQSAPKDLSEEELQKYYLDVCTLFEKAVEMDADKPELDKEAHRKVALTSGALYRSLQRHEDALRLFQIGLSRYPEDAQLLAGVGWSEFDLDQISNAEKTVSRLLDVDPGSDDGRRLWKAIRKTQEKDLTADLSEDLKRQIYKEYLHRRDQSFVEGYLESGVPTKASFEDLVSDMSGKAGTAELEVRRFILQKYGLKEFEFDLIVKQGEREAWNGD
ncbi:MAG: tetratricopeptide repeat protein [Pyrinomonadaceae bacterium]